MRFEASDVADGSSLRCRSGLQDLLAQPCELPAIRDEHMAHVSAPVFADLSEQGTYVEIRFS
jgi:hypothetical protein